ncbi:MAG: hypothetical protein WCW27_06130 [Patescibacteria group bacterium]|jgi:Tol biopolymer transport system component
MLIGTGCAGSLTLPNVPTEKLTLPEAPVVYATTKQLLLNDNQINNSLTVPVLAAWFDTEHILIVEKNQGTSYQIWKQNVINGERTFITSCAIQLQFLAVAPNQEALLLIAEQDLYVLPLVTTQLTRIHEGVLSAQWSLDSKRIVFNTTDNRLLLQQIGLEFKLDTPLVLLTETVASPIFLDERTLAYEGQWENMVTIIANDLITQETKPLTSLRFVQADANSVVRLSPNSELLLYSRQDNNTGDNNIWVIHRNKDVPKLILTKANAPIWSKTNDRIYYFSAGALWQASDNGFDKIQLNQQALFVAAPTSLISNLAPSL